MVQFTIGISLESCVSVLWSMYSSEIDVVVIDEEVLTLVIENKERRKCNIPQSVLPWALGWGLNAHSAWLFTFPFPASYFFFNILICGLFSFLHHLSQFCPGGKNL